MAEKNHASVGSAWATKGVAKIGAGELKECHSVEVRHSELMQDPYESGDSEKAGIFHDSIWILGRLPLAAMQKMNF